MIKNCRDCKIELTYENWYPSDLRAKNYLCKKCKQKRLRDVNKRYRARNREEWNIYMKDWIKRNPEKVKANRRRFYQKHKKEIMEQQRLRRRLLYEMFGGRCVFCGKGLEEKRLWVLHQKNGEKHPCHHEYYAKHREDFFLVCKRCHGGIHFAHDILGLDWKVISAKVG